MVCIYRTERSSVAHAERSSMVGVTTEGTGMFNMTRVVVVTGPTHIKEDTDGFV